MEERNNCLQSEINHVGTAKSSIRGYPGL